jgi:vacuolar protein sorting-associated protein 52
VLFRNYNQTLIDNASSEYFFLTDFLGSNSNKSHHDITTIFTTIFDPTIILSTTLTKHIAQTTTDVYGILLCIRTTQHFAFSLQKRRMPALDMYINSTAMLLWPRFQVLMDSQAESLRRFGVPAGARRSEVTLAPHPVTVRFAGLLEGFLTLSEEGREDEPLVNRYAIRHHPIRYLSLFWLECAYLFGVVWDE